jgi:hypothetical protein
MVRRRERRHLVLVACALKVEQLHLLRKICLGDDLASHSCTSFVKMLYGPHFTSPPCVVSQIQLIVRHSHVGLLRGLVVKPVA